MTQRAIVVAALLSLGLALGSCAGPPPSAYDQAPAAATAAGTPIGDDMAGESCASQPDGGGLDVYCGAWDQPSAQVRSGGRAAGPDLAALATTSPWRAALETNYRCGGPRAATILDGLPAVSLDCTQRLGGWPHIALVTVIGGTIYEADGVAPAMPPLQRAIGVLSGRIPAARAGQAAIAASDSALAQRLAAQAYSSGDIAHYEALMALGAQANQAEDFSAAVIAYRAALALQQEKIGADNPATLAPMLELALNLSDAAHYAEAASLFAKAAALAPASNDPDAGAKLLHYEGLDQLNQDHFAAALSLLVAAQGQYAALLPPEALRPQPVGDGNDALFSVANAAGAADLLANQTRLDSPATQAALLGMIETLRYQAIALSLEGDVRASAAAIELSRGIANANDLAPALLNARLDRTGATLDAATGKARDALADYRDAGDNFSAALPGSLPIAETDLLQAPVQRSEGAKAAALASCRDGLALLKTLRLGAAPGLIGPCLDVFGDAVAQAPAQADALHEEMFEAAELAQGGETAREIGEAAARLSTGASNPKVAAAIRAQQDASARLATLYERRDNFTKSATAGAPATSLADIDRQIVTANQQLRQDDIAVQAAAPNFGQLVQQVVPARDVLRVLRPDEAFLGITTTPKDTWLFMLHAGTVSVARSAANDADLTRLVHAVLTSIAPAGGGLPAFDMADAARIYGDTLRPFDANMPDVRELVIAPSGALLALPFALLPTAPGEAGDLAQAPWLVRQTNLAYVPAAANFVALRGIAGTSRAPSPWFGFGDFQPASLAQARATYGAPGCGVSAAEFAGLPHLPYASLELQAAAAIFGATPGDELLGGDFTVPQVEAAPLKNFRILHFATHALLPTDLPCQTQPAIVTSVPAGAASANQALLDTGDVTNLHLDANLVILSACNTGGGEAGGEALSGLARSFFYAGARALMVTQWSVNDQVSAYLVADTLNRLHGGVDGGPAGSLRAAQLALIASAGHGAPANLADPFFWAAFAVIGDGGNPSQTELSALSARHAAGL